MHLKIDRFININWFCHLIILACCLNSCAFKHICQVCITNKIEIQSAKPNSQFVNNQSYSVARHLIEINLVKVLNNNAAEKRVQKVFTIKKLAENVSAKVKINSVENNKLTKACNLLLVNKQVARQQKGKKAIVSSGSQKVLIGLVLIIIGLILIWYGRIFTNSLGYIFLGVIIGAMGFGLIVEEVVSAIFNFLVTK